MFPLPRDSGNLISINVEQKKNYSFNQILSNSFNKDINFVSFAYYSSDRYGKTQNFSKNKLSLLTFVWKIYSNFSFNNSHFDTISLGNVSNEIDKRRVSGK
jgi:hypothetical protein